MVFNNSSYDKRAGFGALTDVQKKQLCEKALELQLAMMFIMHEQTSTGMENCKKNCRITTCMEMTTILVISSRPTTC